MAKWYEKAVEKERMSKWTERVRPKSADWWWKEQDLVHRRCEQTYTEIVFGKVMCWWSNRAWNAGLIGSFRKHW